MSHTFGLEQVSKARIHKKDLTYCEKIAGHSHPDGSCVRHWACLPPDTTPKIDDAARAWELAASGLFGTLRLQGEASDRHP